MKNLRRYHHFTEDVWQWFSDHKRTLPWRDLSVEDDRQRGYMILVSEVMLQQTQVNRVVGAFPAFLRRFPTLQDLARATNADVLCAWRGMGYNSRALRLRDAARLLAERTDFPTTLSELTEIPGIGPYTAGAILNFAFHIPTPCIDTNIRKIIHCAFAQNHAVLPSDSSLLSIASTLLAIALETGKPLGYDSADWHAALMDLGSVAFRTTPSSELGVMEPWLSSAHAMPQRAAKKREPGRLVGTTFIPRRIFRGRIIEALRDHPQGLTVRSLGKAIAPDWNPEEHTAWLSQICEALTREGFIRKSGAVYRLHS